jgi:predicted Zn-dependent protease
MTQRQTGTTRRRLLAGLAGAAGATAAAPAWAQFKFGFGSSSVGSVLNSLGGAVGRSLPDLIQGMELGEEDEIRMGEAYYGHFIAQSGGVYPNRRIQGAMGAFADPLIRASKRDRLPWDIVVLDDDTVNAWSLPGGKLAVNKGLLRYVADDHELAAVVAHEIGHVDKAHVVKELKEKRMKKALLAIGTDIAADQVRGPAGALSDNFLGLLQNQIFDLITSGYSPENELEADAHILTVFQHTGHDPAKAPNFFRTLLELIPQNSEGTNSLYNSHPKTRERIAKLSEKARGVQVATFPGVSTGYPDLKRTFPTRMHFRRTVARDLTPVKAPPAPAESADTTNRFQKSWE